MNKTNFPRMSHKRPDLTFASELTQPKHTLAGNTHNSRNHWLAGHPAGRGCHT